MVPTHTQQRFGSTSRRRARSCWWSTSWSSWSPDLHRCTEELGGARRDGAGAELVGDRHDRRRSLRTLRLVADEPTSRRAGGRAGRRGAHVGLRRLDTEQLARELPLAPRLGRESAEVGGSTVATGSRSSCVSADGAFDMVGNVWEWVAEWVPRSTGCGTWTAAVSLTGDYQCLVGAATTDEA